MLEYLHGMLPIVAIDIYHDLTRHAPYYGLGLLAGYFCLRCARSKLRQWRGKA